MGDILGVKLPKIELPRFDGKVEEWLSFKDRFVSMIDSKVTLSDIEKLHYLRSALSGDAAAIIQAVDTTVSSYKDTWALLGNYDNTHLIIMRHGELFFQTSMIERDSPKSIRFFVNHIRTHLHALKALKLPVDTWDIPIILHILPKLDRNARLDYEKTLKFPH